MTFDEFQTLVKTAIPTADIDFTHDGQIVIYINSVFPKRKDKS